MLDKISPEAIVSSINLVISAQQAAMISAICSAVALVLILAVGLICIWTAFKFNELVKHTNSIMDRLLVTTANDAEARGNLAGRAELKVEMEEVDVAGADDKTKARDNKNG